MTKEEYLEHVKNNELLNRDPDIYDIEDAWVAGYNHAVEMAAEWLYERQAVDLEVGDIEKLITDFKKAMEL